MSLEVTPFLSENEDHISSKDEILAFCGKAFGMCYLQDEFDAIKNESKEKSIKRAKACIKSGHHSGFEHIKYTFCITGISKMLAMILNNQGKYATSEKSGRYTVLDIEDNEETLLREKWQSIFYDILLKKNHDNFYKFYEKPDLSKEKIEDKVTLAITKKAQENSRLITTVFTKTKMIYSIDVRQLSYLRYEMKDFISNELDNSFYARIKKEMQEFIDVTNDFALDNEGLTPEAKGVKLPFFHEPREEEFGLNYSINEKVSIATFAQNQRHRTTRCTLMMPNVGEEEYFIPEFIKDTPELVKEWIDDLKTRTNPSSGEYPQALLVNMNERGRYEDFIQKAYERLCGAAQYEIMRVTRKQLDRYIENTTSKEARTALIKLQSGARCTFGYKCTSPCQFGPKGTFTREF